MSWKARLFKKDKLSAAAAVCRAPPAPAVSPPARICTLKSASTAFRSIRWSICRKSNMYDLFGKIFERILGRGLEKINYDDINPYSSFFEDDFNKVKRFFLFYLPPIILLIVLMINIHPIALSFTE